MSLFKKILSRLVENEQTPDGSGFEQHLTQTGRSAYSDFGIFRDDPDQLRRMQAFVNAYLGGSYIEPEAAVMLLRSKMNHAGLDFDFNHKIKLTPGNHSFQLNRYGEVFGTTPTHDLLKNGFNRGKDLIPMILTFNLQDTPTGKMYFTDIKVTRSGLADQADAQTPTPQVEEQFNEYGNMLLESSNMAASSVKMMMKHAHVKTKVIEPVFKALMKNKNKLSTQEVHGRIAFAARSGLRKLGKEGKIDSSRIDVKLITGVTKILLSKFKGMKTLSGD